ncbi:DUF5134 domain-containing protein [Kitasatospora paracochleata]|uniref:DUF5134 domain-containing protein n=1 Tax=Kitasatospora paracochleata TaxID=58354 RepID=A0ABT1J4D4_9ACTN|nr:DUF5134 domain-containing protein [Kitasatospora paracochleata]MCP2312295.1 hypothetical protein [Kitasatospora paracochleata]
MHGPTVVSWLLAALTAATGGYCLRRAHACSPAHRHRRWLDAVEAAMGLGMAGMALLPGVVWGWLAAPLAGALLLGALGPDTAGLRTHRLHHGIGALAMAYMALAMAGPAGPEGHHHHASAAGLPLLTGALLLYFGAYVVWEGSRLLTVAGAVGAAAGAAGAVGVAGPDLPVLRLTGACRAAMGIGMFAMLLTM